MAWLLADVVDFAGAGAAAVVAAAVLAQFALVELVLAGRKTLPERLVSFSKEELILLHQESTPSEL